MTYVAQWDPVALAETIFSNENKYFLIVSLQTYFVYFTSLVVSEG